MMYYFHNYYIFEFIFIGDKAGGKTQTGNQGRQGANMEEDLRGFKILFAAVQVCGVLCVVLVAAWTSSWGGGFAWRSHPQLQFNWHPLLMTFGFIYLYGSCNYKSILFSVLYNINLNNLNL